MKARYEVRRLSKAESDQITRQAVDNAFPAVMAAVLFVLYKYRHWHKDKCVKLYNDVCDMLSMPETVAGSMDDREVEAYLSERIGIDWQDIRDAVQIEVS